MQEITTFETEAKRTQAIVYDLYTNPSYKWTIEAEKVSFEMQCLPVKPALALNMFEHAFI